MSVTIYHNPACGTSRNTLAMMLDHPADRFVKEDGEVVVRGKA